MQLLITLELDNNKDMAVKQVSDAFRGITMSINALHLNVDLEAVVGDIFDETKLNQIGRMTLQRYNTSIINFN